jgi:hypothetical protein
MCTAIAIISSELPHELKLQSCLSERIHLRENREEFQFHWWQIPTILPVRWDGKLELLPWGSKSRGGPLPYGGWIAEEHVKQGLFAGAKPEQVVIPANLGFEKGTWFLIVEGIQGMVIQTRNGPIVYMLTQPATNYYRNMTEQSPTMPILVNQVI